MPVVTTVRESILQNLKTTLSGITTTAGYQATINKVELFNPNANTKGNTPLVVICAGPETCSQQSIPLTHCELTAILLLFIRVDESASEAMDTTLNRHLGDIKKALNVDITRGGYAVDTNVTDIDPFDSIEGQPTSGLIINVKIQYRHQQTNPAQAG